MWLRCGWILLALATIQIIFVRGFGIRSDDGRRWGIYEKEEGSSPVEKLRAKNLQEAAAANETKPTTTTISTTSSSSSSSPLTTSTMPTTTSTTMQAPSKK